MSNNPPKRVCLRPSRGTYDGPDTRLTVQILNGVVIKVND